MLCSRIVIAQGNFQSRRPQHAGRILFRLLEKFWGVIHICPEERPQKFEKSRGISYVAKSKGLLDLEETGAIFWTFKFF